MKRFLAILAAASSLGACTTASVPQYSLSGGETGIFRSANAGKPIPLDRIKGMDERQLQETFGAPHLDRRDAATRVLRYQSDACTLFVFVTANRAEFADAYDLNLRPLKPADQCAGSVAAQKRRAA